MSTPTLEVACLIRTRSDRADASLLALREQYLADAADPMEYRCMECGLEWNNCHSHGYAEVTCSNCYSEKIAITAARLAFYNWGEQNGGEWEQHERFEAAKKVIARRAA